MSAARVFLIDIETSPNEGYTWGKWEQNVLQFTKPWQLLSFAYKELGDSETHCLARPDYKDKTDRAITKAALKVFNRADILIGHNIDKFDNRKMRAKFLEHDLAPPKPYKTIDTLKIARAQFAFDSNTLNDLAATLGLGKKVSTGGFNLWIQCMAGYERPGPINPKAWAKMVKYNKHDVVLLEKVYNRLRVWYPSHPNFALYDGRPGCPVCASPKVHRRGYQVLRARKSPRYQCQNCSHWFNGKVK